ALRLTRSPDPELMIHLGEALSYGNLTELPAEAIVLFIGAYEMAPNIQKAMWYGGLGYAAKGEYLSAAKAWEQLLAQGAPPDVAAVLSERIAALRALANPAVVDGPKLTLNVSLGPDVDRNWPATARLFIAVRDPNQPGPPVAAVQRSPDSLPTTVTLTDANAMMPGRNLSSAGAYEIVARVSLQGNPEGSDGDYVGRLSLSTLPEAAQSLTIDTVDQR
ncbi:MAG: hypothetical protein AAGF46_11310, partial [Pseudomonadota bacterium]